MPPGSSEAREYRYGQGTPYGEEAQKSLTMYLFIGLILLLAVYLVRGRRTRAAAAKPLSSSSTTSGKRASFRPPKRRTRTAAPPAPAPAAAMPVAPMPVAAEPFAAPSAPPIEPSPLPRPAPAIIEPAPNWTPEDTIAEPGWPLPGEISGAWSPESPTTSRFLDGATVEPVAVVEWPTGAQSASATADDAGLAEASADTLAETPAAEQADEPAPAGPPLWVPGEAEVDLSPETALASANGEPIWLSEPTPDEAAFEEAAVAVWLPETPADPDAPPLSWSADAAEPEERQPIWLADPEAAVASDESDERDDDPASPAFVWTVQADAGSDPAAAAPDTTSTEADAPAFAADPPWAEPAIAAQPEFAAVEAEFAAEIEAAAEARMHPAPEPEPVHETPLHEQSEVIAGLVPALLDGLVPITRVCDRLGVTPRMLALVRILAETPLSVTELARHLGVSRPLVADLCVRLENMGLARREPLETDRRRVRVVLTEAGHKLQADSVGAPEPASVEAVISGLTPAARAQLLSGLQALANPPA